jgi:hypothetical protein
MWLSLKVKIIKNVFSYLACPKSNKWTTHGFRGLGNTRKKPGGVVKWPSGPPHITEYLGFESRQGVKFLGFYILQGCCQNLICIVIVFTFFQTLSACQGYQIGRIFAYWAIVTYLWAAFWKMEKQPNFLRYLSQGKKVGHQLWQKWRGLHFGRVFLKLIWSPWSGLPDGIFPNQKSQFGWIF